MLDIRIRTSDTGPVRLPNLRGVLDDIASDWTTEIRQRTRSGRDADGRQMRRRADGSVSRLHDSGAMLGSLRPTTVDDRGFQIAPTGARNAIVARTHAAHPPDNSWAHPNRPDQKTHGPAVVERLTAGDEMTTVAEDDGSARSPRPARD